MLFAYEYKADFTDRMVQTIETGTTVDAGILSIATSSLSGMLLLLISAALI